MAVKFKLSLMGCILLMLFAGCKNQANTKDQKTKKKPKEEVTISLPRKQPSEKFSHAMEEHLKAVKNMDGMDIHSIMVLKKGNVMYEKWIGEGSPNKPHVLWSVSKTFTSIAVGMAIDEGKLNLKDKLVSFFPEDLPENPSEYLKEITVRDLLTMSCGHDTDPTGSILNGKSEITQWKKYFLAYPVKHKPGTFFCYNTLGTYMLSAIVQKVTGMTTLDYLAPRLFLPLGIEKPKWELSPEGINCGGFGLYLKTEDMAKVGQLLLQKGKWNGERILSKKYIKAMSGNQVKSCPAGTRQDKIDKNSRIQENSDWFQGYGYQMWQCRHDAFRADGMLGQYIIVLPKKDAVIVVTANVNDMQKELNMIWDYILPIL